MEDSRKQKTGINHLKKKKRKKRKQLDLSELDGLHKVVLSQKTQKLIGAEIGKDVTFDKPWVHVDKSKILDNAEVTEFSEIESDLLKLPRDDILLVYIPDDEKEYHEYYVSTTESAIDTVTILLNKQKQDQDQKLYNSIYKNVGLRAWFELGSANEVKEEIVTRNRPLLEVEIQSKYPLPHSKAEFQELQAEDVRHGYVELGTGSAEQLDVIFKKRTDIGIQVTPTVHDNQGQTLLMYPENAITQYYYELDLEREHPPKLLKKIQRYTNDKQIKIRDFLDVNYHINLYTNDYKLLLQGKKKKLRSKPYKDALKYRTFFNVDLCKDKMISSLDWNSSCGSIAVAYNTMNRRLYRQSFHMENGTNRAVCSTEPVLIWSLSDYVNPKIVSEAHREISTLSFNPYNKNILLGGCSNGQIVLWDLTNRLSNDKNEYTINSDHKTYMFLLMDWAKCLITSTYISVTTVSDLKNSHKSAIVSIRWLPKNCRITRLGKTVEIKDDDSFFPQFITASEDGTICVWNLEKESNESQSTCLDEEIKQLPKGVRQEKSPYRYLHLNFKPELRINVFDISDENLPSSIFSFWCDDDAKSDVKHLPITKEKSQYYEFEPVSTEDELKLQTEFVLGTTKGEFMRVSWEDQEDDSDKPVFSITAEVNQHSVYHDGPVTSLTKSSKCDVILTTGGRLFVLWVSELKSQPLFWRKRKTPIAYGSFDHFQESLVMILTHDGCLEVWNIHMNSKTPEATYCLSNNPVTELCFLLGASEKCLTAIADAYGCFRVYSNSKPDTHLQENIQKQILFVQRETLRKNKFINWQNNWIKKNRPKPTLNILLGKKQQIVRRDKFDKLFTRKLSQLKLLRQSKEEQRQSKEADEKEEMRQLIMAKKKYDPDQLILQREPLQILKEEHEKKKKKMRVIQRSSAKIYSEKVSSLFPAIVAEKPLPEPDRYAGDFSKSERLNCYRNYARWEVEAKKLVKEQPFDIKYSMRDALVSCRQRREVKDTQGYRKLYDHRNRHQEHKRLREGTST